MVREFRNKPGSKLQAKYINENIELVQLKKFEMELTQIRKRQEMLCTVIKKSKNAHKNRIFFNIINDAISVEQSSQTYKDNPRKW